MRANDGVGTHDAVLFGRQMHRAALAAHQAVIALHEFAEHLLDRYAARQGVGVTAVGAETEVAFDHGLGKAGGNGLLTQRQVARALDQVLQEQVEGALLGLPQADLGAVQLQALLLSDIVVQTGAGRRPVLHCRHAFPQKSPKL